jgi:hypothetical protein
VCDLVYGRGTAQGTMIVAQVMTNKKPLAVSKRLKERKLKFIRWQTQT